MQNFTEIASCVHDLRHLFKTDQSCKLWKPILANQDEIWNIGQIRLDHMTIEILCTDLRDFWINSEGVISKRLFYISRPTGGAIKGPCEKCGAEVLKWHPGSVCAKFGRDRANCAGD